MNPADSSVGPRLARLLAILLALASLGVIVVSALRWPFRSNGPIFQLMFATSVGIGALGYLLLEPGELGRLSRPVATDRLIRRVQAVVFFSSVGGVLLVLDSTYYVKPPVYYAIIAVWGASLLWVTVTRPTSSTANVWWLLGQTVVLGLVTVGSSPLINPFLTGPDAYWHFNRISQVVENGYLTESAGHYYYYFIVHAVSTVVIKLTGTGADAFSFLTVLWGLLIVPSVYLLVRATTDSRKLGLVSSQVLAVTTLYIFGIINKSPTYLGFLFVFLSVYIIFRSEELRTSQSWTLFLILSAGAFFTHFVTALILAVFLTVHRTYVWVVKRVELNIQPSEWRSREQGRLSRGVIVPFAWFVVAIIVYHVYVNTYVVGRIFSTLFAEADTQAVASSPQQALLLIEVLQFGFGFLGVVLIFLLGSLGGFWFLKSLAPKQTQVVLWFGVMNVLAIGYFAAGAGSSGGTLRLVLSSVIIGVLPASVGLWMLVQVPVTEKPSRHVFAVTLVLLLALAGPASYLTWEGNDVFNNEIETPQNYAQESLVATHGFMTMLPGESTVAMDSRSRIYIANEQRGIREQPDGIQVQSVYYGESLSIDGLEGGSYLLVRERSSTSGAIMGPDSATIYDNGDILMAHQNHET